MAHNSMPRPLVSVIVPTRNSGSTIRACLQSIKDQTYRHIECIVVDNTSSDKTATFARHAGAHVMLAGPERSAQRNRGADASKGEYLLFIDSDMELQATVIEDCVRTIQGHSNIKAITIPEKSFGVGFWAACKSFERSFYDTVPWMNASRFMSRETYKRINGFDEHLIAGEDFDMQNRIIQQFGNTSVASIASAILHNEGALTLRGACRKKFAYGKTISAYRNKPQNTNAFRTQASIIKRILLLSSRPREIVRHPILYIGTILLKTVELASGGLGYAASSPILQSFHNASLRIRRQSPSRFGKPYSRNSDP